MDSGEPYWKRYRREHREAYLASRRSYYAKNREKELAVRVDYRARNHDACLERTRQWRARNKEKVRAYQAAWEAAHPDDCLERCHRRRARKGNGEIHFTQSEFRTLKEFYGGKCLRCGATDKEIVPDHVVPLSEGGSDSIDNIQPLCRGCNSWKHSKTIDYRPPMGGKEI